MYQTSNHLSHWAWFPLIVYLLSLAQRSCATLHNVSISPAASQIKYTPFLCGDSPAEQCEGAWQAIKVNGQTLVSTNGPAPGSLIPQMFFQFRASTMYLSTSAFSNATTNLTVSNNGKVLAAVFNSSVGMASILNLNETEISTVALTFIADARPTRLDISTILLTVTRDPTTSDISDIFPSMTLPASPTLPTFGSATPSASTTPIGASSDNHTLIKEAVGITLGLSLGLTAITVLGYLCWRRRRRRRPPGDYDSEASRSPPSRWPPISQPPRPAMPSSGWTSRAFNGWNDTAPNQSEKRWWSQ